MDWLNTLRIYLWICCDGNASYLNNYDGNAVAKDVQWIREPTNPTFEHGYPPRTVDNALNNRQFHAITFEITSFCAFWRVSLPSFQDDSLIILSTTIPPFPPLRPDELFLFILTSYTNGLPCLSHPPAAPLPSAIRPSTNTLHGLDFVVTLPFTSRSRRSSDLLAALPVTTKGEYRGMEVRRTYRESWRVLDSAGGLQHCRVSQPGYWVVP